MASRRNGRRRATWAALGVWALSGPSLLVAQRVPTVTLKQPGVAVGEGFGSVAGVRELSNGSVLVADAKEPTLLVIGPSGGAPETIGRTGDGPGEYRSIYRVHALGGDTTLLEDVRARRWLLCVGRRIVSTVPRPSPTGWGALALTGTDRRGQFLEIRGFAFRRSPGVPLNTSIPNADSLLVLRHRGMGAFLAAGRLSGRVDTVARLRGPARGQTLVPRGTVGKAPLLYQLENPLAVGEQAMLFPDGWIALARTDPYRVEWIGPQGARTVGAPLPDERVSVDDVQRRAAIDRKWSKVRPPFTAEDFPPWPAVLPPFAPDALMAAPDGALVVLRMPDARRRGTVYDVVDRAGRLVGRLALRPEERIIGFGRSTVYVARTDADDLQWITRHPWP